MKTITLILVCSLMLGGCARKSDLDAARENLAEAQRKIEILENERVSRSKYDMTRASLKLADERIATLERELRQAQEQGAVSSRPAASTELVGQPGVNASARPTALGLTKGTYEQATDTHVYSADAELSMGQHLKVSSPNGLMVSDPELKVVGGDLSIKATNVMLDAPDGLLMTAADGSVKFTGKTLTMRFDENKTSNAPASDTPSSSNTSQTSESNTPTSASSVPPAAEVEPRSSP